MRNLFWSNGSRKLRRKKMAVAAFQAWPLQKLKIVISEERKKFPKIQRKFGAGYGRNDTCIKGDIFLKKCRLCDPILECDAP